MKPLRILAGSALALCLAVPTMASTSFHVSLNLGSAPPPPVVVVHRAPQTTFLPEYGVYVVNDPSYMNGEDVFQVGGYWYCYDDGYWYRARSWRGPFTVISDAYVPVTIARIPANHWRHDRWTGRDVRNAEFFQRHGDYRQDNNGRWHSDNGNRGRGRGHGNGRGH
jgi:hypothetical protein